MQKLFFSGAMALLISLNNSGSSNINPALTTVSSVVFSEKNGKPLDGVFVYTISGEEEVVTKSKGEFSIQTSKKTPFILTAEHWDFETSNITITNPAQRILFKLKPKQR